MTKYALNHRGVIFFFFFLVVLMGIRSIKQVAKQEAPKFPTWNAVIITRLPGASPLKVEELVTEKVEEKLKEIGELKKITSISQTGVSYVFPVIKETIENDKPVWDKVREKLPDLNGQLPQGASTPWLNNDFGAAKSFVIAITGDGFDNRELIDVAKDLKKDLGQLKYVMRVDTIGEQEERITVGFSNTKLSELGISADVMAQTLIQQNILAPGGDIRVGPQNIRLEPSGEFQTVEDIGKTVITLPGYSNVFFLKDVATITREYIDPPVFEMRYMGKPAVGLVVEMQDGGQILELGESVKQLLADTQEQLYWGIDLHIVNYQPKWVQRKIDDFVENLLQAVLMVIFIMVIALGWREGIIITTLIPFSLLITITVMELLSIPIHQISLMALIVSLGMLVDNGIVMTESISNYVKQGMGKIEAAIRSSRELTVPLLTSTATTVAAFLPIALAKSGVGIYCRTLTYGVGIVLLSSFFVTMTIIPLFCVNMLKVKKEKTTEKKITPFGKAYIGFMNVCLRFKYFTIVFAVFLLILTMNVLGPHLRNIFFPPNDRDQLLIDFYMPEGTDYRTTREKVLRAEQHILDNYPEMIHNMAVYIGEGGPRFQFAVSGEQRTSNYAQFVINNPNSESTDPMKEALTRYFEENYEDAITVVKRLETGPPVGAPVQIRVYGKDLDKLYANTQKVRDILERTPGTQSIRDDWGPPIPKLTLTVNQDQARRVGVSSGSIAQTMRRVLTGESITEFREDDTSIPIVGRARKEDRTTLRKIQEINLLSVNNNIVPLTQVANIGLEWETGKIRHLNRRRTITVLSYLDGSRTASAILEDVKEELKDVQFEPGYGVSFGGAEEGSNEGQESINVQLPIAMAILVMILVGQFANVRKMVIILMTIPLSFIGVIIGLLVADYPFGFMAFIGVISLAGIVVNNAILLIEKIDADLAEGKSPMEAIVSAGQRRAFPIVLTTLTTMCGLLPLALSGEFWGPMAVAIMGGLIVSTILTLVVIPTLYAIFFRVKYERVLAR